MVIRKYITDTVNFLPMSGKYDFANSNISAPVQSTTPAIQSRSIADTLTTLDGQVIFIGVSGFLAVASGLNNWYGLKFT